MSLTKIKGSIYGKSVPSIVKLKQLTGYPDKAVVFVESYYGDGLNRQGEYQKDASDTTSADNGGTIIVANDDARWKFIGMPTVRTFGAKGDGATDDTAAITSYDTAPVSHSVPSGNYIFDGQNIANINTYTFEDSATIRNSIYSPVVLSDAGKKWLQHNHLELQYPSQPSSPMTIGNIPPAPQFQGAKQKNVNALAFWYQDFGMEFTRVNDPGSYWYDWRWLHHGAAGDGYQPERQRGYVRGNTFDMGDPVER